MSILNTAAVWRSYPGSGEELLLALALCECGTLDDGAIIVDNPKSVMRLGRFSPDRYAALFAEMLAKGTLVRVYDDDHVYRFNFS